MAFGFGKKDKTSDTQQAQQISPEALALLEQMAASGQGQAQIQPNLAQANPAQANPAMMQQPVQSNPALMQQPVQSSPSMAGQPQDMAPPQVAAQMAAQVAAQVAPETPSFDTTMPPFGATAPAMGVGVTSATPTAMAPTMPTIPDEADAKGQKKSKRQRKPKLSREEKQQAAKLAKEAKTRDKRRKKLSKTRFSRASYLRDANGNAVAGLALWVFMIMVFVGGPFFLNTQILLPQTRANIDIVNKITQLHDTIKRSQPQIELALRDKSTRENEIKARSGSFAPTTAVVASLNAFIAELKANDIQFAENSPAIIVPQDVGVNGLLGQTLTLSIKGDFLTYLRLRNNFVRAQNSVRVSEETIQAEPNDPVMSIMVTITIPSKNS